MYEDVENVQIQSDCPQNVVFRTNTVSLASTDELGVNYEIESEYNHSNEAVDEVHSRREHKAEKPKYDECTSHHPKSTVASCEIRLGCHGIDSQSYNNASCHEGSLQDDL